MTTELEFVNDWSELEAAVAELSHGVHTQIGDYGQPELDPDTHEAVCTLIEYVPRLLTQYASLVELSFALTEGWEQYATLQTPSKLYLPDHR